MLNNQLNHIAYKISFWAVFVAIAFCQATNSIAADLSTLFTTPQERQIINANRYKTDKKVQAPVNTAEPEQIRELVKEEVKKSFIISGITVSNEGQHSVWINNQVYQDGEKIEGKSRVRVLVGNDIKVRITAPDGKQYFGTSGETLEINYLEASDS